MVQEKELIIDQRDFDKELVTSAIESGVRKIIVPKGFTDQVHKLGRVVTIALDGDLVLGKDLIEHEIKSKQDEDKALIDSKNSFVLIHANDWKIIPLENLVSKSDNIYVSCSISEIPTMLSVLEKGVRGVVIKPKNRQEIIDAIKEIGKQKNNINLVEAEVTNVKILGSGERACVDTCNIMGLGEGMLIGNSPKMLFLVQSESMEVEYCATRPFRVNAGSIHSYVLLPEGKTKYLYELASGDEALCVNSIGETKKVIVGRNKIENRPLVLIEAKVEDQLGAVILQNAETIRVVVNGGNSISVAQLKIGDKILVKLGEAGRHFGTAINEKIIE